MEPVKVWYWSEDGMEQCDRESGLAEWVSLEDYEALQLEYDRLSDATDPRYDDGRE